MNGGDPGGVSASVATRDAIEPIRLMTLALLPHAGWRVAVGDYTRPLAAWDDVRVGDAGRMPFHHPGQHSLFAAVASPA